MVYFTRELDSSDNTGGRLNFIDFETHRIDLCIDFIGQLKEEHRLNDTNSDELCVVATGGGAYKYYDKLKDALKVNILREEEMECLIIGTLSSPSNPVCLLCRLNILASFNQQDSTFSSPRSPTKCSRTAKPSRCSLPRLGLMSTRICW